MGGEDDIMSTARGNVYIVEGCTKKNKEGKDDENQRLAL